MCQCFDSKCKIKYSIDEAKTIFLETEKEETDYIVIGSNCRPGLFGNLTKSIMRDVLQRRIFLNYCPQ